MFVSTGNEYARSSGEYFTVLTVMTTVELEQPSHLTDKSRIGKLGTIWLQRLLLCSSDTSPEALLSTLLLL